VDTFVPTKRKKNRKKVAHGVIIREVTMRVGRGNLLISRSSQFHGWKEVNDKL
jgi:hypothetical protein